MQVKLHRCTFCLELYARLMAESISVNFGVSFSKERLP